MAPCSLLNRSLGSGRHCCHWPGLLSWEPGHGVHPPREQALGGGGREVLQGKSDAVTSGTGTRQPKTTDILVTWPHQLRQLTSLPDIRLGSDGPWISTLSRLHLSSDVLGKPLTLCELQSFPREMVGVAGSVTDGRALSPGLQHGGLLQLCCHWRPARSQVNFRDLVGKYMLVVT